MFGRQFLKNDTGSFITGAVKPPASVGHPIGLTLIATFTVTTLLSAVLLFSLQPMFAKMVLPSLGGSASVWAVALCFFQGALLAGYCYAHALNRFVAVRLAGFIHLGVMAVACLSLPIAIPRGWEQVPIGDPYLWQLGLFAVAIGVPFFAVAANAPLLQSWFARTGHPDGRDPYFLYGASNLGSLLALLAYPLLLEPAFGLKVLSWQWAVGFVLLAVAIALCFGLVWYCSGRFSVEMAADWRATSGRVAERSRPTERAGDAPIAAIPTWTSRLGWIGLAFVPSALLTAYTTHVATDVASAPLIWVVPLALYLLTFVLVFRAQPLVFVPCLLAVCAGGFFVFKQFTTAMIGVPENAIGLLIVIVIGVAAAVGYRIYPAMIRSALVDMSDRRPLATCMVAVGAAVMAFVVGKMLAHQLGGDDVQFPAWIATVIGILAALGGATWFHQKNNSLSHSPMDWLKLFHVISVVAVLIALTMSPTRWINFHLSVLIGVCAFVFSGLVAHRTLYDSRPAADYLTEFYLCMSLGGVLGGLFAALLAPQLFAEVIEYPILLVLTMLCRPLALKAVLGNREESRAVLVFAAVGCVALVALRLLDVGTWMEGIEVANPDPSAQASLVRTLLLLGPAPVMAAVFAAFALVLTRMPLRQSIAVAIVGISVAILPSAIGRGEAERSYFGVYRVANSEDGRYRILLHGSTIHGAQRIYDDNGAPVHDPTPATYFHPASPMAKAISLVRERLTETGVTGRYGVVGLGTGSLACYAKPNEQWRFFEIDGVVAQIAKDPNKFSFLSSCRPQAEIVLGDARLTLASDRPGSFDLLIIDAFSSDAIPIHLLTAEAIELYLDKLARDGVLVLHISNRYLDLKSVLASTVAQVGGLKALSIVDQRNRRSLAASSSSVVVVSNSERALAPFRKLATARPLTGAAMRAWTDDYSDILTPLLRGPR